MIYAGDVEDVEGLGALDELGLLFEDRRHFVVVWLELGEFEELRDGSWE